MIEVQTDSMGFTEQKKNNPNLPTKAKSFSKQSNGMFFKG